MDASAGARDQGPRVLVSGSGGGDQPRGPPRGSPDAPTCAGPALLAEGLPAVLGPGRPSAPPARGAGGRRAPRCVPVGAVRPVLEPRWSVTVPRRGAAHEDRRLPGGGQAGAGGTCGSEALSPPAPRSVRFTAFGDAWLSHVRAHTHAHTCSHAHVLAHTITHAHMQRSHACTCTHVLAHAHSHILSQSCTDACTLVHTTSHSHTLAHAHSHTCTHTHTCSCTYTCSHTCTHARVLTRTLIHTCTHTHTTRLCSSLLHGPLARPPSCPSSGDAMDIAPFPALAHGRGCAQCGRGAGSLSALWGQPAACVDTVGTHPRGDSAPDLGAG